MTLCTLCSLPFRSSHGFNKTNMVPTLDLAEKLRILKPAKPPSVLTSGIDCTLVITSLSISTLLVVEVASGNSYVTYNLPSSSVGMKPVDLFLKRKNNPTNNTIKNTRTYGVRLIQLRTPFE